MAIWPLHDVAFLAYQPLAGRSARGRSGRARVTDACSRWPTNIGVSPQRVAIAWRLLER